MTTNKRSASILILSLFAAVLAFTPGCVSTDKNQNETYVQAQGVIAEIAARRLAVELPESVPFLLDAADAFEMAANEGKLTPGIVAGALKRHEVIEGADDSTLLLIEDLTTAYHALWELAFPQGQEGPTDFDNWEATKELLLEFATRIRLGVESGKAITG
jgi:hypothetical protein